jgi:hypothetical protein
MRLYVRNSLNEKIVLDVLAPSRDQLANKIGADFFVKGEPYSVNDVLAEPSGNDTAGGAIVGGLIGLLGGGAGVIVGGFIGGLLGNKSDNNEKIKIINFNESVI